MGSFMQRHFLLGQPSPDTEIYMRARDQVDIVE